MRRALLLYGAIPVLLSAPWAGSAETRYKLTGLGHLSTESTESQAWGVNGAGQVVGWDDSLDGLRGFVWDRDHGLRALPDLPGGVPLTLVWGVTADGTILGGSSSEWGYEAFRMASGSEPEGLGFLFGGFRSEAFAGNAAGEVAGAATWTYDSEAVLWPPDGEPAPLGFLYAGYRMSIANGIDEQGRVAGGSDNGAGFEAFLWEPGRGMTGLGHLLGGGLDSEATAINAAGQVVGSSDRGVGFEAFLWEPGAGMIGLGHLPGGGFRSEALAINDAGLVVGRSDSQHTDGWEAFLWEPAHGIRSLNELTDESGTGWFLIQAAAISDVGMIVGYGMNPERRLEAFLLEPVTTCESGGDLDSDGVCDGEDLCPAVFDPDQSDADDDGAGDACDNCILAANADQADADENGIGDLCQCGDVDGDGLTNVVDALMIARGELLATSPGFERCDVNGDESCDVLDALVIARGEIGADPGDQRCPAYHGSSTL